MVLKIMSRLMERYEQKIMKRNGWIRCKNCRSFICKTDGFCVYCKEKLEKKQKEQEVIDCAMQHIKVFYLQSREGLAANFGEPCATCKYVVSCKADWLSKLETLAKQSSVKISVGYVERKHTKDNVDNHLA